MPARLPIIHQTEATECGLACLAMLANYHGHNIDLHNLRARFNISLKGADLGSLMSISGALGLSPRALTLDMSHMGQLKLPALLHWDMNHFVVLKSISKNHVIIHDPASGARKLSLAEFGNHFTGVALELTPRADFKPINAAAPLKLSMLWSKISGLKRAILQTLILSLLLQALILLAPLYLQYSIDQALPRADKTLLLTLALGFGALAILRSLSEAVRSWAILIYGQQLSLQMAGNVFAHMLRLPLSYFERRHIGDIISRINSTQPIQQALTRDVATVFIDAAMGLITLCVMFAFSPLLTVIVVLSALAGLALTLLIYPHLRAAQEETITRQASENSYVIESLRANMTVKLFGREAQRESSWRNLFARYINSSTHYGKLMIWQNLGQSLLSGLQLIAIIYFGVSQIITPNGSAFTLGMLFAFLMYRQLFTTSLTSLLQKLISFRLLGLHVERISDIVLTRPEAGLELKSEHKPELPKSGLKSKVEQSPIKGQITLDNISFRYSPTEPWIIKDFSLTLDAGALSVFHGSSGGGKTTLLKLILGLYAPQKGRILLDGRPIADYDKAVLRSQIGVVMQDDTLISGSLADNISFFDAGLDMDRAEAAAKAAQIHDDIVKMPMGYQSMVGDMGSILSGGQRQRVLLARALYINPRILCLDEGTANLDEHTERGIAQLISDMDITRLIIAHRPEFISRADALISI